MFIVYGSAWVRHLVSDTEDGTYLESVWREDVEENIWTKER
jgi:hypothetical protein